MHALRLTALLLPGCVNLPIPNWDSTLWDRCLRRLKKARPFLLSDKVRVPESLLDPFCFSGTSTHRASIYIMAQVLFDIASAYVRLALRAYFTILFVLLGLVGDRCCLQRTKLSLYNCRPVNITNMTGWLGGARAVSALATFRASPAALLHALMILASVLGLLCDLAVSGLVTTTEVVARCHFNTSGPYTALSTLPFAPISMSLAPEGYTYNLITQAQSTSVRNGGLDGVYKKINGDLSFRAASEDIIARWKCQGLGEDRSFSIDTKPIDIYKSLLRDGLLFNESAADEYNSYTKHGKIITINDLFIWSGSQDSFPTGPWSVRAAVEIPEHSPTKRKMTIYDCYMETQSIEWFMSDIDVQAALSNWAGIVGATLKPNNIFNAPDVLAGQGSVLESNLNSIIMNQGAAINPVNEFINTDPYQGCLAPRAQVSPLVVALFVIATAALLAISIYWAVLTVLISRARTQVPSEYAKAVERDTPNGLLTWMREAIHQIRPDREVRCRGLNGHYFGPVEEGQGVGLQESEGEKGSARSQASDEGGSAEHGQGVGHQDSQGQKIDASRQASDAGNSVEAPQPSDKLGVVEVSEVRQGGVTAPRIVGKHETW